MTNAEMVELAAKVNEASRAKRKRREDDHRIRTTNNESFELAESELMAALVYKRFGRSIAPAAEAWRRLLQNNCTDDQFMQLVYDGIQRVENGL